LQKDNTEVVEESSPNKRREKP